MSREDMLWLVAIWLERWQSGPSELVTETDYAPTRTDRATDIASPCAQLIDNDL
jgi:hypothetical protein